MTDGNIWTQVLEVLRDQLDADEYRRWFSASAYASDSGDQISVWVPSAADVRHLSQTYMDRIERVLRSMGRTDTVVRFLPTGYTGDDEFDDEE